MRGMTTPQVVPTTTITLTQNLPAALRDELGIAAADDDAGDVLKVEHDIAVRLVTNGYAHFGSASNAQNTGGQKPVRRKTQTLDFPSIAAGASSSLPVSVPGAKVGEGAAVVPPTALAAGVVAGAVVTAANTVTVTVANATGAAVDLPSGSWKVAVVNGARR